MDNKKWYIIKTNPRAEKQVALRLTELGIENYLPLHRQLKTWYDRKKYVDEVLFKSYVFVHTTDKDRQEVFNVSGIVRYLFVSGQIAKLTEKEIAQIKIFCTLDEIKIDKKYEKGDEVEVIKGQFIGQRGQLTCSPNGQKLKVYLSALGCFASLNINKDEVRQVAVFS
jgi:transcription antitermination factor NusG